MAEYLCEEDMNTGEYISRDLALKQLNATCLATDCDNYNGVRCRACAYADAMDFIDAIPAADVQPIDRWISVKDRLPEADYDCFVWYSCDTAFGKSKSWGIAHCSRCDWYTKHLDGDNIVVLYWMPLPEPPKDGEHND